MPANQGKQGQFTYFHTSNDSNGAGACDSGLYIELIHSRHCRAIEYDSRKLTTQDAEGRPAATSSGAGGCAGSFNASDVGSVSLSSGHRKFFESFFLPGWFIHLFLPF
jgi:hypothetical protein